jgi:hypothetical protein
MASGVNLTDQWLAWLWAAAPKGIEVRLYTGTVPDADQTLADIGTALEDWEDGEDAAQWHASGGPDELGELAEDEDECDRMLGAHPTLVIFDEVRCWDAADSS